MARGYASAIVDAAAGTVWAHIRDFGGLQNWNPGVAKSEVEDGKRGDQVGAIRSLNLANGKHVREQLLSHSDAERSFSYNFQKTHIDIDNYCATLRVSPVTDGDKSFVEWWATFDCDRDKVDYWEKFWRDVFQQILGSLQAHFRGK